MNACVCWSGSTESCCLQIPVSSTDFVQEACLKLESLFAFIQVIRPDVGVCITCVQDAKTCITANTHNIATETDHTSNNAAQWAHIFKAASATQWPVKNTQWQVFQCTANNPQCKRHTK